MSGEWPTGGGRPTSEVLGPTTLSGASITAYDGTNSGYANVVTFSGEYAAISAKATGTIGGVGSITDLIMTAQYRSSGGVTWHDAASFLNNITAGTSEALAHSWTVPAGTYEYRVAVAGFDTGGGVGAVGNTGDAVTVTVYARRP